MSGGKYDQPITRYVVWVKYSLPWTHADTADAGPGRWPLNVEMVEMLGAERLVYGRLGDAAFTLRVDATLPVPQLGQTVFLRVDAEHLHWFDRETQQRV